MLTPKKILETKQKMKVSCLVCNQDNFSDQQLALIQDQLSFQKPQIGFDQGISQSSSRNKNSLEKQLYNNILCTQCEQKFNSKENQLSIFRKLIGFFEDSTSQSINDKEYHTQQSKQNNDNKLKIKDLIRLVMHMLNEITGLAKTVHKSIDKIKDIYNPQSIDNHKEYTSKLQSYIQEHLKLDEYLHQQINQSSPIPIDQQNQEQNNLINFQESDEDEGEGKGKQFINSFSMESPFSKLPKRKINQSKVDNQDDQINSGYIKNDKITNCNRIINKNLSIEEANCLSMANNSNELFSNEHNSKNRFNKSIELGELNKVTRPKSGNNPPNIPQFSSKRYQAVNKSVGNQQQLQKLKSNNDLNISICSNNEFTSNSFFTPQNNSMMPILGVKTSQYQIVNIKQQYLNECNTIKNSAQQIIFGDGPASRKLLNIKQYLQRKNSQSDNEKQNTPFQRETCPEQQEEKQEQSLISQLQKANQVKRALLQKEQKIIEKKKIEFNMNMNIIGQQDKQNIEQPIALLNQNKSINHVKYDNKNNLPQIPSSTSSSSQNCINSTNYISQTQKTRSYQGSALELVQLTEGASSSINITSVQNENQVNTALDLSHTDRFINLPLQDFPETPTNKSEIDQSLINQKNFNKQLKKDVEQEQKQSFQQIKLQAPLPKTLKYRKPNLSKSKNNIQSESLNYQQNESLMQENIDDIIGDETNKSKLNQTVRLDQYYSADNSIIGGLKSLNNSVNISNLNKTMLQDSTLSQSTLFNSKAYTTTPIQEKIIIKSLMKNEYGDSFKSGYHKENTGLLNETKYIISARWWREWMEFVGFNETVQIQQDSQIQIRKDRPKKIKNKFLLKGEQLYSFKNTKNIELKDNLLEHYDYEAIPKSIFSYLKMWYGVDYEIIRFLKFDPSQPQEKSVYLDLYPEKTLAHSLPIGIRKRQKNTTLGATNSQNLKDKKEDLTTFLYSNKSLPSKYSKHEKLNITQPSCGADPAINSKDQIIEGDQNKLDNKKKRKNFSLDIDKINITLTEDKKNSNSNYENHTENTQRSIAKDKSKACNIF